MSDKNLISPQIYNIFMNIANGAGSWFLAFVEGFSGVGAKEPVCQLVLLQNCCLI